MQISHLVERDFGYHPPANDGVAVMHERVRLALKQATIEVLKVVGVVGNEDRLPSRELSSFKTAMEEAMFWANAHIAREISTKDTKENGS